MALGASFAAGTRLQPKPKLPEPMSKPRYPIAQATMDCARALFSGSDRSATTIRCCINDLLDAAQRDGYSVKDDYDQPRAVATVKRLLAQAQEVAS